MVPNIISAKKLGLISLLLLPFSQAATASAAAVLTNSTVCEACALCELCRSCTPSVVLAFVITALITTLLLASIYIPVLIAVFKSYSKIKPDIAKIGASEGDIPIENEGDSAREEGQGRDSEGKEGDDEGGDKDGGNIVQ